MKGEFSEMETNNITLRADENNVGSVQIADDVVSMIAALAASEVEGVSSVVGDITNEVMSKVGMKKLTKGVRVDLLDNKVSIDLSIMIGFGYPIPETSRLVQEKVKNSVETMTGLTVEDINIRVAAVNMSKVKG
jgi:uncharacterized alkaline shock family protein YloU